MTTSRDELVEHLQSLGDDAALEAANLLAGDLLGATTDRQALSDVASAAAIPTVELAAALQRASLHDTAELARVALLAAFDAGHGDEVEEAVNAVGQKAFIVEATVIGIIALAIMHQAQTSGAESKTTEMEMTTSPDGTISVKTKTTTKNFSVGAALAPLAKALLRLPH